MTLSHDGAAASPAAVVLLSGGLDSATVLAIARQEGLEPIALSFAYGQRHAVELSASRGIAASMDVREHRIIEIDLRAFGGSALTDDIDVPKDRLPGGDEHSTGGRSGGNPSAGGERSASGGPAGSGKSAPAGQRAGSDQGVPVTYVPARNTIFLSYALALAEVRGAADVYIGVNAVDYSGYPDCRPEYIAAFERMANLATRAAVEGRRLRIHAPLIKLAKHEIIARGLALGVDYALTRSCYDPDALGRACGHCDSCLLRLTAFRRLGMADPAPYVG